MNAECQRIARRDRKVFLTIKCKEIEGNNRIGKTRGLFKKIRYKGNISCNDGDNKGQKWYGHNRSRILIRGGTNKQKNYAKKIFMTQITTMV